ncbi:MAG: ribonuclease HII [Porphyromonas sp.]|nr:ribonuclease HII [Porphyromonas sp.]
MLDKGGPLPIRLVADRLEAGVDEVGRGCLAGPVVAAAVILPANCLIPNLDDSKRLTAHQRELIAVEIKRQALAYAIAEASVEEIDGLNILRATYLAMNRAIQQLNPVPEHLLIDGNRFQNNTAIPFDTVVKGDAKVASIAAASILAKTYRDSHMRELARHYPHYDWEHNMGYGTPKHLYGIQNHGITIHHRRTFAPCQPTLFDR